MFREMLTARQLKAGLVCVGLDPLPSKVPPCLKFHSDISDAEAVYRHMYRVVKATAPFACMFKPQRAYYEAIQGGEQILRALIRSIREEHPDIPVFMDCKRLDIDRTQEQYGTAHLKLDNAHGMNFNPYMGKDTLAPLVKVAPQAGFAGLCYTSNQAAREIQDALMADGRPMWEFMAEKINFWASELGVLPNMGLVMAAAYVRDGKPYSDHLKRIRELYGSRFWLLIPGIGTQGGVEEETVQHSFQGPGSIAVNSSSGIIFASQDDDFEKAVAGAAEQLRDILRDAGGC